MNRRVFEILYIITRPDLYILLLTILAFSTGNFLFILNGLNPGVML